MKKILITGISGFVAGHFVNFLAEKKEEIEIYGISRSKPSWNFFDSSDIMQNIQFHQADLRDKTSIQPLIREIRPDFILHLAAQSSVAESWKFPESSIFNNISGFLNVIETIRLFDIPTKILSVGSAEQYGIIADKDLPITEDMCMHPENPYAAARVAQEHLAKIYVNGFGLDICCTRSFNHCGPGQSDKFVVSSIVKQFVQIAHGKQENIIHIGNGTIIRDFLDVSDVIKAYYLILNIGPRGQTYNICSGNGYSINDIIKILSKKFNIDVTIRNESAQLRPIDNPKIVGSNQKIRKELGWTAEIPFEESLQKLFDYWNTHI